MEESKKIQTGDVSYEENSQAAAIRARVEMDGLSAEKSHVTAKVGHYYRMILLTIITYCFQT